MLCRCCGGWHDLSLAELLFHRLGSIGTSWPLFVVCLPSLCAFAARLLSTQTPYPHITVAATYAATDCEEDAAPKQCSFRVTQPFHGENCRELSK